MFGRKFAANEIERWFCYFWLGSDTSGIMGRNATVKSKHRRQFSQHGVAIVDVLLRKLRLSGHRIEIQENLAFIFSVADENLHRSPMTPWLNRESTPARCL